jgi:hypothetical protein
VRATVWTTGVRFQTNRRDFFVHKAEFGSGALQWTLRALSLEVKTAGMKLICQTRAEVENVCNYLHAPSHLLGDVLNIVIPFCRLRCCVALWNALFCEVCNLDAGREASGECSWSSLDFVVLIQRFR